MLTVENANKFDGCLTATNLCLSNAMHSIGQNIKSRKRPFVRQASVDKNYEVIYGPIFTKFAT